MQTAIKYGKSWWKPQDTKEISAIKEIDSSIFEDQTTGIPVQIYDCFPIVKELNLDGDNYAIPVGKGKVFIKLIYDGQEYECDITKKIEKKGQKVYPRVVLHFNKELMRVFRQLFKESWEYILAQKELFEEEREKRSRQTGKIVKQYISLPEEYMAYIEFRYISYDTYEIKCTKDSQFEPINIEDSSLEEIEEMQIDEVRMMQELDANKILNIHDYISSKGLHYQLSDIHNFYLSLRAKPFVILSGISGTGKSKLVRTFAEAIGAQYELIPVKPDWSDATDLLGYRDINNNYHDGKLTKIIKEAIQIPHMPHIICIDEMNLARVEYYFSDFLSLIESRERDEKGSIITDDFGGDLEDLYIPDNIYIVGTVNMDETTFQFSKKVLDRANTIELSEVDLTYDFGEADREEVKALAVHNDALKSEYLLMQDCRAHKELAIEVIHQLTEINEKLKRCQMHFAYRVRDEVIFYMIYNERYQLLTRDEAFDYQLLQKVLPRINGTSTAIKDLLISLLEYCLNPGEDVEDMMLLETFSDKTRYPKSAYKLREMIRRFEEDGFTSFWF